MLIILFLKASQEGNVSHCTLLHKLPPSDNQTNCFSVNAISDLLPQNISFLAVEERCEFLWKSGPFGSWWIFLGEPEWGCGNREKKLPLLKKLHLWSLYELENPFKSICSKLLRPCACCLLSHTQLFVPMDTRLLCPWNFPGNNMGGFPISCMDVRVGP